LDVGGSLASTVQVRQIDMDEMDLRFQIWILGTDGVSYGRGLGECPSRED
jgi:hypothetical protein